MRFVVIDFETFFSDDFTLSKMTTESYIRDSRFEAHGAAIKWSKDHAAKWYDERQLRQVLKEEDWNDVFLIAHHFQFDGLILSHHYDVHPKMRGCTLSMARLVIGNHIGVALGSLAVHFGLAEKNIDYFSFKGKHWHEMDQTTQQRLADGACRDVEITWCLFERLIRGETGKK